MPFRLPTHVTIRPGCFAQMPDEVAALGSGTILIVYDQGLRKTPWPQQALRSLREHGLEVITFDAVEPNPKHTTIDALAARARTAGVRRVVGLGGGSVLDAAKAVALLVNNPGSCTTYEGKNRYQKPPVPFLAIPTTCGTGSEVTWVSVITHADERRKMSLKGEAMFPTRALVDADVLATLPPHLVATTGLDALTHALEATTGTASNPASDALAEKAIALLFTYLRRAAAGIETDAEAREAVMRASTLAGMAFGNADVGGVHCLSETIGGLWDLPHGLCNAVLLAPVLRYHIHAARDRLAALYPLIASGPAPGDPAEALIRAVETLVADLEVPSFASFGLDPGDYPRIAAGAVANNSNGSNPQPMAEADYLEILRGLD